MYLPVRYVDRFLESFARGRQEAAAKAEAKARRWHIEVDTALLATRGRRAADLIVKQAKRWCADVIVRGTHGRRGLSRMLLGSDAEMVVREAPVPVLLVRSKRGSRRGGVKRG